MGRVLKLCWRDWLLGVCRFRSGEGFCVFWRRLDILDVLGESRFALDDHGEMIVARVDYIDHLYIDKVDEYPLPLAV